MDEVVQRPEATQKLYRKGMHQTNEFEEKLLALLSSFRLEHERSFLTTLPKTTAAAVYDYYDGRIELHEESNGLRFAEVLKAILEKCQADSTGVATTFEGTLRANFIELARSAWSDTRVFSSTDQTDLGPLMRVSLRAKPHYKTTNLERTSSKTPFEQLQGRYLDDRDLIIKFNGSCYTIQQLYNGEKLPTDSEVNFFGIMTVVLKHCPLSSSSVPTLRTEIRAHFVSLFNLHKDNVAWEPGQKEAVLKLMDSTEKDHFSLKQRQDHTKRPLEKGTNWTPLWVVAGLFVTFFNLPLCSRACISVDPETTGSCSTKGLGFS